MGSADELVDVVDEHDRVLRVVTRAEMRAGRLRHRTVFIAVVNASGDVLAHRRADHKDVWPGRWDLAAGGVLAAGELYDEGAVRELAEELGITDVALERLGSGTYEDDDVAEIATVYRARWDGPVHFADGEVSEARWMTLEEVQRGAAGALDLVPDSVALVLPLL
jgi:isopentenyldiphosphate isomerase